jgi:hypothetical protein
MLPLWQVRHLFESARAVVVVDRLSFEFRDPLIDVARGGKLLEPGEATGAWRYGKRCAFPTSPHPDSFNLSRERDSSAGDFRNLFVASSTWELPLGRGHSLNPSGVWRVLANGWQITGIVLLQSGMPFAITQTANFNAFAGFGVRRPNIVASSNLPSRSKKPSEMVQHSSIPGSVTVHTRQRFAQSSARPQLQGCRYRIHQAHASAGASGLGVPYGNFQCDQHTGIRATQRGRRKAVSYGARRSIPNARST